MKYLSDEQMAKLPKWARMHVELCENTIDHLRSEKAEMFAPVSEAQVPLSYFHGASGDVTDDQPLPAQPSACGSSPSGPGKDRWDGSIEVCIDPNRPGELNIYGSGMLSVIPHATNAIKIKVETN